MDRQTFLFLKALNSSKPSQSTLRPPSRNSRPSRCVGRVSVFGRRGHVGQSHRAVLYGARNVPTVWEKNYKVYF